MKPIMGNLILFATLTSCQWTPVPPDHRETVNFDTDSRILRGVWTGPVPLDAAAPTRITLNLTATYKDDAFYAVSGTAILGSQTSMVEGWVNGSYLYKYLKPQTSPVPSGLFLTFPGSMQTSISCPRVENTGGVVTWTCSYAHSSTLTPFTLTKGTSTP